MSVEREPQVPLVCLGRLPVHIVDEAELTDNVVCNCRAYTVPKDVADELRTLRQESADECAAKLAFMRLVEDLWPHAENACRCEDGTIGSGLCAACRAAKRARDELAKAKGD